MAKLFSWRPAWLLAPLLLVALQVAGCSSSEDRAKSYYEHGMQLLAEHENAKASIEFKNAVKLKKDYVAAWLELAKIEALNRNVAGQISYLRTVVELDPKDIADRLELARLLVPRGGSEEALKLVNAVSDLDDHNADALAIKAVIELRTKNPTEASKNAEAALDLDPKNTTAMMVLARDRLEKGDKNAALQILDKAESNSDGKDPGVELFKLRIFEQAQDWAQVEALLKTLIERYPDSGFRNQLVRLYLFQKRPDDAEKELRAVIAAKPDDPAPELALVRLLHAFKGPAIARQELVDRVKSAKDVFPYQLALAQFDFAHNNFKDSEQLLKTLIANSSAENALTAQLTLAQMYLLGKQLDAADGLVAQVLQKDSRNSGGLTLRASINMERGQLEPAINDLREALNEQPQSVQLMLLLATAYERSGAIELADKQYADALSASRYNATVGLNYIAFLQRRGSATRADDVLADLAERWPQNKQVLAKLAEQKLARKDWTGAEALANRIKYLGGDFNVAEQILGAALLAQDKYDEGIDVLQSAYAAAPTAVQPMLSLIRAYLRAKQTDKAVALLQKVLKADPNNAEAYVLLGSIQQQTGALDQARSSFKTAIDKQPKFAAGYQALANFYFAQKNVDEAQNVIGAGLKEQPDDANLHMALASIDEAKENYDAAIAEYEGMLIRNPQSLVVANNLASMLSNYKTDKASLERAQTLAASLRKSPVPQFKDTLGWVSYQNGDYKSALPLLEEAAAALPDQPSVHYHLGMSYIAAGQVGKAFEQLNIALKKAPGAELKAKIEAALKNTSG